MVAYSTRSTNTIEKRYNIFFQFPDFWSNFTRIYFNIYKTLKRWHKSWNKIVFSREQRKLLKLLELKTKWHSSKGLNAFEDINIWNLWRQIWWSVWIRMEMRFWKFATMHIYHGSQKIKFAVKYLSPKPIT